MTTETKSKRKKSSAKVLTAYIVDGEFCADKNLAEGYAEGRAYIRGKPIRIETVVIPDDLKRTLFRIVEPNDIELNN